MALSREPHDDQLIRHLLGDLPDDEAQRLEEASIVDDEFAARLQRVEDDLVDAYARGRLEGDRLARFESFYLASRRRREKVEFAKRFLTVVDGAPGRARQTSRIPVGGVRASRRWSSWIIAAAAVVFLTTGMLLVQHVRLRRDMTDARARVAAAEQHAGTLAGQLADRERVTDAARQALADARGARPQPMPVPAAAIALVLMPQTRGLDPVPVVAVPADAETLPLELRIVDAEAARYSVSLKDPANNRILWRSPPLASDRARRTLAVPIRVPAGLLKPQHYALDLFALHPDEPEFIGTYAFEVVRQ